MTVSGAYEEVDLGNGYQGANPDPGTIVLYGEKNGYYVKAAYLLPNTPLQVYGRYEDWRFASLNNVMDQEVKWKAIGANYYFNKQNLKLTVEFSQTDYGTEGTFGGVVRKDFNTVKMIHSGTSQRFAEHHTAIEKNAAMAEALRSRMADIDKYNIKGTTASKRAHSMSRHRCWSSTRMSSVPT